MVHKPALYRPLEYGAHRSAPGDDSAQHFVVGFVLALIVLVLLFVLAVVIHHRHGQRGAPRAVPAPVAYQGSCIGCAWASNTPTGAAGKMPVITIG